MALKKYPDHIRDYNFIKHMNKILIGIGVILVLGIGIFLLTHNPSQPANNTYPTPTDTSPVTVVTGTTVKVVSSTTLGNMLVDGNGKTVYFYMPDELNKSNCIDQCATNWPPVSTAATPVAGDGIAAELLATITRDDGTTQITYNGRPLYYWSGDVNPGDATGQNNLNVWFVVSPDGAPIQTNAVVNATTSPLGSILIDRNGWTVYMYTKDTTNTSQCYDDCAQKWPPLLTVGNPVAGPGLNHLLIGTTTRSDGSTQVTYKKYPLYYWYKDTRAGDTLGQGVGNVWYMVSVTGTPIKTTSTLATSTTN